MCSFEGPAIGFSVTGAQMGRAGADNDGYLTPPEVVRLFVATASNFAAVDSVRKCFYRRARF